MRIGIYSKKSATCPVVSNKKLLAKINKQRAITISLNIFSNTKSANLYSRY